MLRTVFVLAIIVIGAIASLTSPFYALLFYLWNSYFRPEQWVWTDTVGSLDLSAGIGIFLVLVVLLSGNRPRLSMRLVCLLLFFVHSLVSTLLSEHSAYSWTYWLLFARIMVVTGIMVTLVTDVPRLRLTFLIIALSLGFESAKQGWVELILHPGALSTNTHPVLGDNNGVAQGMMMLAPLFVALAATSVKRWERWFYLFMMAGVFARGLSTYSRGGFLAAATIALVWLVRSRHRLRGLVFVVVVAGVVLSVMPATFWARMSTITTNADEQDDSVRGRLHFWETAAGMVAANPIAGVGFNGFSQSYNSYDQSSGEFGIDRAVHSTWFGLLAELGVPGIVLLVLLLYLGLLTCLRVQKRARDNTGAAALAPYARALEMSLAAYIVSGTFLNSQYSEMAWHFIALSIILDEVARSSAGLGAHRLPTGESPYRGAAALAGRGRVAALVTS